LGAFVRSTLVALAALVPILLFVSGCASVSATAQRAGENGKSQLRQNAPDPGQLSEREKWSHARDAYEQAKRAELRKDSEAAAYYYEVALELLGSLDLAAIEVPTRRVLSFQRKVLQSYDRFLASVDKLPSTAGPQAVLETSTPGEETEEGLPEKAAEEQNVKPPVIRPNAPPLPEVPVAMNAQVAGQINFFINKGRKVMLAWMERTAVMFPRLRPILAEEGLPEDVLYLAMIESGLNLRAHSYSHAAGVWQFIASTGRIYGLRVDRVYDERYHVEAATRAACRYLRNLYEQFGDWYLAFAAYNCGEGRIEREVARYGTRDYWRMHRLPRQTRGYVPAYLATRAICRNPTQYGFPPMPKEIPFECERVQINGAYKLEHVAQAAGHDPQVVADLNPEFVRGVTPAGTPVTVRLPRRPDTAFETRLAVMPKTVVKPTKVHRVRSGETLASIARKYDTSTKAILAQPENRRVRANRLRVGQEIIIPVPEVVVAEASPPADSAPTTPKATAEPVAASKTDSSAPASEIVYTVHSGETLGKISRQLGVPVEEILRQNKLRDPNVIQPGQKLRIRVNGAAEEVAQKPAPKQSAPTQAVAPAQTHRVRSGETVWSIARDYGQDPLRILSWNGLDRDSTIYPGQQLIVNKE
jgi:membrane-bound lytic murein transglycosylase D